MLTVTDESLHANGLAANNCYMLVSTSRLQDSMAHSHATLARHSSTAINGNQVAPSDQEFDSKKLNAHSNAADKRNIYPTLN